MKFLAIHFAIPLLLCCSFKVQANCDDELAVAVSKKTIFGLSDDHSRAEVLMGKSGEEFQIVLDTGVVLKGSKDIELERRVNLTQFPLQQPNINLATMPSLVVDLLDQFYLFTEKPNSGIHPLFSTQLSLRPLATETAQHFHLNGTRPEKINDLVLNNQGLSLELLSQKQIILMGPEHGDGDALIKKYRVGRQGEESIYFDTTDGELRNKDIAIRVKSWFPFNSDGTMSSKRTGRSLFMKISKEQLGHFTRRIEINLPIPLDMKDSDLLKTIDLLLQKEGFPPTAAKLHPSVRIHNIRYGVDLVWRTSIRPENYQYGSSTYTRWIQEFKKIGFLTVDQFTAFNFHTDKTSPATVQMEYEIFPEELALYNSNVEHFNKFFEAIERRYQTYVQTRPKYLQGID